MLFVSCCPLCKNWHTTYTTRLEQQTGHFRSRRSSRCVICPVLWCIVLGSVLGIRSFSAAFQQLFSSFSAAFKLCFRPANRATVDVVFGITVTATSLLLGEVGLVMTTVSGLVDLRDPPRLARLTSKMAGNLPSCTRSVVSFFFCGAMWVCLKMVSTPKPNGFADHYPY